MPPPAYNRDQMLQALRAANAAGDSQAVQAIAAQIRDADAAGGAPAPASTPPAPGTQGAAQAAAQAALDRPNLETFAARSSAHEANRQRIEAERAAAEERRKSAAHARADRPFVEKVVGDVQAYGRGLVGLGETGLALLTGAAGGIIGLAGSLPVRVTSGEQAAMQTLQKVAEAITVSPNTYEGQVQTAEMARLMAPIAGFMDSVAAGDRQTGEYTQEWIKAGMGLIPPFSGPGRMRISPMVQQAQERGFRVAPSEYGANAGVMREAMERLGGREAVEAKVVHHNQTGTNAVLAADIGLHPTQPLTRTNLDQAINGAYQAYTDLGASGVQVRLNTRDYIRDIDNIDRDNPAFARGKDDAVEALRTEMRGMVQTTNVQNVIDKIREIRDRARTDLRSDRSEVQRLGMAERAAADALERQLDIAAFVQRQGDTYDAFVNARQRLARIYTIEQATDEVGNVNLAALARETRRAQGRWEPGAIEALVTIHSAFPKSTRLATSVRNPSVGISPFDLMLGGAFGASLGGMFGMQAGAIGAAGGLSALIGLRALGRSLAASAQPINAATTARLRGVLGAEGIVQGAQQGTEE